MAAGDFTATQLGDIVAEVQEIFLGERHKQGIRKKTDAAQRILENQQVNLTPLYRGGLDDNNNCIGFEVTQLKNCDTTVDDCDITSCTLDGIEIESVAEQYDRKYSWVKGTSKAFERKRTPHKEYLKINK